MLDKNNVEVRITMSWDRAVLLMRSAEVMGRIGMGQFKDMIRVMVPDMPWEEQAKIEKVLKGALNMGLDESSYYPIHSKRVPDECQNCWEAYQHIRREISWAADGKDWRTDARDWKTQMGVSYDNPMKYSNLPGVFKVEVVKGESK